MADSISVTASQLMKLYNRHLSKRSEKSLRATPVLAPCFDQRPLPGKAGVTMYVPRHFARDGIRTLTDGTPIDTCATSAGFYSGTVVGYGDARMYSDFIHAVHEIPTMISDDVDFMVRDMGLFIDRKCRAQLSGISGAVWLSPDSSTVIDKVKSSTALRQSFLFAANTTLAGKNAPTFADGKYKGFFHPNQTYDLFIATSAGSQLGKNQGANAGGFLEQTEYGSHMLERATIGTLGNVSIIQNTNTAKYLVCGTGGMCGAAGNSGYQAYVFGPGAAAAVDLATARLRTYTKGLGSAGTQDPIDQNMSVGVKAYFVAIAMDKVNRAVKTASGKSTV